MNIAAGAPTRDLATGTLRAKLVWLAALYFASGFPYGVVNEMLPIFLRQRGVGLSEIGALVGVAGYAWSLKFFWAPLVDRFGTRKWWIVGTQTLLGLGIAALAVIDAGAATLVLLVLLLTLATLSATQDISIDAYTIEILEERELGPANGVRVTAYRGAMLTASGLLVALAAVTGWRGVFLIGGGLMLAAAALTASGPTARGMGAVSGPLWQPIVALARLPHLWAVILFALTFKLGDAAMQVMSRTFLVDAGLSLPQIGTLGTLGIVAIVTGALLGGFLILRWGIFRALWLLGLVQALSNLGYFIAARVEAPPLGIGAAKLVEDFTGGLGTAAFLAFMMSICEKRYAATQYALLSALFVFGRQTAASFSGELTERMGYADYFLLTFALALPAFALLPWIRRLKSRPVPVPD